MLLTNQTHNDSLIFSVIIPTYNRAGMILKTVQSILNQTYHGFEIIVVDDGSTDDTEQVLKEIQHPAFRYIKTVNQERGAARNVGIVQSKGDYIVFLDSDDEWYVHCLETAMDFIREQTQLPGLFHVAHEVRDEQHKLIETTIHLENINEVLIQGNPLACMNMFVKADVAKANLFNENRQMAGLEDWELWLRLAAKYPILQAKRVSGLMHEHKGRSSNNQGDQHTLVKRVELFMQTVLSNTTIQKYYNGKLHQFRSSCFTFISLHLAISGNKKSAIRFLLMGVKEQPAFIFKRRFGAILKNLLL